MNADDREAHELAAKAAGLRIEWVPPHNCYWVALGQGLKHEPWEPRCNDGQSFRLAVAISKHCMGGVLCLSIGQDRSACEFHYAPAGDSVAAGARLSVLLAAAAIGRAMP